LIQQAAVLDPPRGYLPPASALYDVTPLEAGMAAAGDLLWLVTYLVAIWIGFKHKTYAIPLLAVALNVTWEFLYTAIYPSDSRLSLILHSAWLIIDLVIVFQLYRYGRREQRHAVIRNHYPLILTLTLAACLVFQVSFDRFFYRIAMFPMVGGTGMAFMMNLVMSALFIWMLLERENLRGISRTIAWTKMIGTALISLGNTLSFLGSSGRSFEIQFREAGSDGPWQQFTAGTRTLDVNLFYYMFVGIFVLDLIYVVMVHRAFRRAAEQGVDPGSEAPVSGAV
jgi:hypothetical protein